jgi:hypothetical protein
MFAGKVTCGVRGETSGQSWTSNTVATDGFYQTVTRPHHLKPQGMSMDCVGRALEGSALRALAIPAQFLYRQALPGNQHPFALVE